MIVHLNENSNNKHKTKVIERRGLSAFFFISAFFSIGFVSFKKIKPSITAIKQIPEATNLQLKTRWRITKGIEKRFYLENQLKQVQ